MGQIRQNKKSPNRGSTADAPSLLTWRASRTREKAVYDPTVKTVSSRRHPQAFFFNLLTKASFVFFLDRRLLSTNITIYIQNNTNKYHKLNHHHIILYIKGSYTLPQYRYTEYQVKIIKDTCQSKAVGQLSLPQTPCSPFYTFIKLSNKLLLSL